MYMYICIYIIAACLQITVDGGGGGERLHRQVQVGRQSQLWNPPFAPSRSGHSPTVETFLFSSPATIYVSLVFKASCFCDRVLVPQRYIPRRLVNNP